MSKHPLNRIIFGIIFFSWSIMIISLSVIPGEGLVKIANSDSSFRWDYVEHFGSFVLFSLLFLQWRKTDSYRRRSILLLITGTLFAIVSEGIQLFIPSRSFNHLDLLFNLAGLFSGLALFSWLFRGRVTSS